MNKNVKEYFNDDFAPDEELDDEELLNILNVSYVSVLTNEAKAVLKNFNGDTSALEAFADKMEKRKN